MNKVRCVSPYPPLNCLYASLSEQGTICNYHQYCDYQVPRDSRNQPYFVMLQDDVCICSGESDSSGSRCVICGKKK